jgi:choline transport protein
VLGWQTGCCFAGYAAGTQIQALVILNYTDSYVPKPWHGTLLAIAVLAFAAVFNTFLAQRLHVVEGVVLVLHICGFFGIMIPLWVMSPLAPSTEVWTTFYDPGWGNQGLSSLVGIVASVAPLLGADAVSRIYCSTITI